MKTFSHYNCTEKNKYIKFYSEDMIINFSIIFSFIFGIA